MTEVSYEALPQNIKDIVDSWDDNKDLYKECKRIVKELEAVGWTADYGLCGEIDTVVKMNVICTKEFKTATVANFEVGNEYRHLQIEDQHLISGVVFDQEHFNKYFEYEKV